MEGGILKYYIIAIIIIAALKPTNESIRHCVRYAFYNRCKMYLVKI